MWFARVSISESHCRFLLVLRFNACVPRHSSGLVIRLLFFFSNVGTYLRFCQPLIGCRIRWIRTPGRNVLWVGFCKQESLGLGRDIGRRIRYIRAMESPIVLFLLALIIPVFHQKPKRILRTIRSTNTDAFLRRDGSLAGPWRGYQLLTP